MSSHHFVKEGQEPSVWVIGNSYSEEVLGTLLEWSPKVIASIDAADKLFSLQIKIDQIIIPEEDWMKKDFYTALYPLEWTVYPDVQRYMLDTMQKFDSAFYFVGLSNEVIQQYFEQSPLSIRHQMIGISENHKWICPLSAWSKWFSKDKTFHLTGNIEDWEISGEIEIHGQQIISKKDQLIQFQNKKSNCIVEEIAK